jgi:hypothetical protein
MKNLDSILEKQGIKKVWFIKNILQIPVGTFYLLQKENRIPTDAVQRAMKHLKVTFEELTL